METSLTMAYSYILLSASFLPPRTTIVLRNGRTTNLTKRTHSPQTPFFLFATKQPRYDARHSRSDNHSSIIMYSITFSFQSMLWVKTDLDWIKDARMAVAVGRSHRGVYGTQGRAGHHHHDHHCSCTWSKSGLGRSTNMAGDRAIGARRDVFFSVFFRFTLHFFSFFFQFWTGRGDSILVVEGVRVTSKPALSSPYHIIASRLARCFRLLLGNWVG